MPASSQVPSYLIIPSSPRSALPDHSLDIMILSLLPDSLY
jgi:hypothetical protein